MLFLTTEIGLENEHENVEPEELVPTDVTSIPVPPASSVGPVFCGANEETTALVCGLFLQ